MKVLTSVITVVTLPLLVIAHSDHVHHARLVSSSAVSTSSAAPPSSISGAVPSATTNGSATMSTPNITVSLLATNPTAVPLASIVSNEPSGTTLPLATTATPGTIPTFLPGAPPLPNIALLNMSAYPPWDIVPPTDSPEVLQWIQDVYNTGLTIPSIPQTNPGGCANNSAATVSNAEANCWWTCSTCVSPFDITTCPNVDNWGLTYDDGPSFYTSQLLQYLDQRNLKSTFFVVGSRVAEFPATLQVEFLGQHQIAVHTWSHHYLTSLTNEQIIAELGWSKKIIKDVLGVTPNIMRPPYGDIDDRVRNISIAMGLTPVIWTRVSPTVTFDTGDFNIQGGTTTVQQVLQNWENILGNVSVIDHGFIVLEHDLFQQTVQIATGYILPDALAHNPPFTIQPVVECLQMPLSNAYIETNNKSSNPPILSGTGVTLHPPTATSTTGGSSASKSGADARFSIEFSLMFMTTIVTLLASVFAVRF